MEQPTPSRKKDAKGTQAWKETEAKTHTTAKEK
jgi:hypothetical protein